MDKLPNNYAFIDSQNLNLGVKSQGWILDFAYLKKNWQNKREAFPRDETLW